MMNTKKDIPDHIKIVIKEFVKKTKNATILVWFMTQERMLLSVILEVL